MYNRKAKNLHVRIADNGNVIIDGVNYKGVAVSASAILNFKGEIKASCITNDGCVYYHTGRGWTRAHSYNGARSK